MRYLLIAAVLLLTACKKEETRAEYRVNCGNCTIEYTDKDGTTRREDIVSFWGSSFLVAPGAPLSLSAWPTGTGGKIELVIRSGDATIAYNEGLGDTVSVSGSAQ
jgi:hypothetical protein